MDAMDAPLPTWPLPITGERVRLRALRREDLEAFHGYRSDPEVSRYQGWLPMDRDAAARFIDDMQDVRGPVPDGWIQLGFATLPGDRLAGDLGLHLDADGTTATIGYSCAREFQRQGLATEAVRLLVRAVFDHTACTRVLAMTDARNLPSERLLIGLGFVLAGSGEATFHGEPCTELTYVLSRP